MKIQILAVIALSVAISGTPYACPTGTHPVCTYDGSGRSVCHRVPQWLLTDFGQRPNSAATSFHLWTLGVNLHALVGPPFESGGY